MKLLIPLLMSLELCASTTCVRVGEGTIAPLHEEKLSQHGVQTIGVIEIDQRKKEAVFAKGFKWFESYSQAASEKPVIWDICTPPEHHLSALQEIIRVDPQARIIVEKPICMSHQIPELQELLKTFQGKIAVNENYLSSYVTEKVCKVAFEELKLSPIRIIIEMDKNRTADFKNGRYVHPQGAFQYEGTHMLTILQSVLDQLQLSLPAKPTSVVYEDLSLSLPNPLPNQGSADIVYKIGELEIHLYSSMKGTLKHRFPPYAGEDIKEHETASRYRVLAIEGLSKDGILTTVAGFYEPLANHPRSLGEVAIIVNGGLKRTFENVPDDTMGNHLGRAVAYLTGKIEKNPCPPEKAVAIVHMLDTVIP